MDFDLKCYIFQCIVAQSIKNVAQGIMKMCTTLCEALPNKIHIKIMLIMLFNREQNLSCKFYLFIYLSIESLNKQMASPKRDINSQSCKHGGISLSINL